MLTLQRVLPLATAIALLFAGAARGADDLSESTCKEVAATKFEALKEAYLASVRKGLLKTGATEAQATCAAERLAKDFAQLYAEIVDACNKKSYSDVDAAFQAMAQSVAGSPCLRERR